ncbi:MAG: hypothetical protein ACJAVK_003151 [Akkermansiaceae bacterium]|jgi:hypothetical protein
MGGTAIGATPIISKPGDLPISRIITQDQAADASLTTTLTPLPEPPAVKARDPKIPEAEKGGGTNDGTFPKLRVFHNGAWTPESLASLKAVESS